MGKKTLAKQASTEQSPKQGGRYVRMADGSLINVLDLSKKEVATEVAAAVENQTLTTENEGTNHGST